MEKASLFFLERLCWGSFRSREFGAERLSVFKCISYDFIYTGFWVDQPFSPKPSLFFTFLFFEAIRGRFQNHNLFFYIRGCLAEFFPTFLGHFLAALSREPANFCPPHPPGSSDFAKTDDRFFRDRKPWLAFSWANEEQKGHAIDTTLPFLSMSFHAGSSRCPSVQCFGGGGVHGRCIHDCCFAI